MRPDQRMEPVSTSTMREIKDAFDPHHLFNPGKIIPDGRYEFDADLRIHAGRELTLDTSPATAQAHAGRFAQRLESLAQLARQQRMRFISCLTTDDPLTVLRESLCHRHPLR